MPWLFDINDDDVVLYFALVQEAENIIIMFNFQPFSVSCGGVAPGAFIPDPCNNNSSRYYYRCITRSANATKLECDEGLVFNPSIGACFLNL